MAGLDMSPGALHLQTFQEKLSGDWKRKAACGRHYIDTDKLLAWLNRVDTDEQVANSVQLLRKVYSASKRQNFVPTFVPSARSISAGDDCALLVFSILLKINHGDLVDLFQKTKIVDKNLSSAGYYYRELEDELERNHIRNAPKIVSDFEETKWSFCPAPIKHCMRSQFHGGKWVLPFCKRERINEKGGTAELWQISIQEDVIPQELRDAMSGSRFKDKDFGWVSKVVDIPMSCLADALCIIADDQWEKTAFIGLQGQKGIVQYLGEYSFDERPNDPSARTFNILLEYGELDLDEFFADTHSYPPVRTPEIVEFWQSLFKVAEALARFQKLDYKNDGFTYHFDGWHTDLKPDNILRVHGEFKLADFGFARFKHRSKDKPTEYIEGGTETYGAPETDRSRTRRGTRTPVTQTIDTWSFGCVLSITATWVVLGFQGILQYETLRKRAIKKLRERKAKGEHLSTPTADDAFHDGNEALPEILYWHNYLRSIMRTSDTVSRRVLDLVEGKMLCKDPAMRITSSDLCKLLVDILKLARLDRSNSIATGLTKDTDETVLEALLEFDKKAPSNAAEAAQVKSSGSLQISAQRMTNSNAAATANTLSAIPQDRPPRKSRRIGKSDRLDNIPLAKTAHRAEILEKELNSHTNMTTVIENSNPTVTGLPSLSYSPTEYEPEAEGESGQSCQRTLPAPSGQLANNATLPKGEFGAFRKLDGPSPAALAGANGPRPPDIRNPDRRSSHSHTPQENLGVDFPSQVTGVPLGSTQIADLERYPESKPSGMLLQELPVTESRSLISKPLSPPHVQLHSSPAQSPAQSPTQSPAQPPVRRPCYDIVRVRRELDMNRPKGLGALIGKTKKDTVLKKFIKDRDIKFIVDNGSTMRRFWGEATFVLETLAMKLAGLDDDGLDLVFTIGQDWNVCNAKRQNALARFKRAMENATPIMVDNFNQAEKTNMNETLGQVFDDYLKSNQRKRMTLLVLTDGIWQGSVKEKGVEKKIAGFVQELLRRQQTMEDRRFSIQFIRFGDDANAIKRLDGLDNQLSKDYKIPDIIDTVPWTGRVQKMILGSFKEDEDEDEGEVASESVSQSTVPMDVASYGMDVQQAKNPLASRTGYFENHTLQGQVELPGTMLTSQTTPPTQKKPGRFSRLLS